MTVPHIFGHHNTGKYSSVFSKINCLHNSRNSLAGMTLMCLRWRTTTF